MPAHSPNGLVERSVGEWRYAPTTQSCWQRGSDPPLLIEKEGSSTSGGRNPLHPGPISQSAHHPLSYAMGLKSVRARQGVTLRVDRKCDLLGSRADVAG